MRTWICGSLLIGALAAVVLPASAVASENAIKARQGYMQVVLFYARPLFGMAKGKVAYDAKAAQAAADGLKAVTGLPSKNMWPKGSDNVAFKGKTRALPAIWEANSKVGDASKAFKAAAATVAAEAGKGEAAMKAAVGELGKSCGGCHKPFRAKEF
ncbi:MAG: c-type cytochrome [Hyphomicrobiaceae bacterium]